MMYLATLAQAENASARQRVAAMSAEAPPALAKLGRCLSQPPDAGELVRAASNAARNNPTGPALRPPALVRGLTATPVDDPLALKALVQQALGAEFPSWAAASPKGLELKDVSGIGGGKTFKVSSSAAQLDPPAVALHSSKKSHSKKAESQALFMRRMGASSQAIAACGFAPRRVAEGSD